MHSLIAERDQIIELALLEDIGNGDLTASLIEASQTAVAHVISREDAVICGVQWFQQVFDNVDSDVEIEWFVRDGDTVAANQTLCKISGRARSILTAERTALNFMQMLSGTATLTNQYVRAIEGSQAQILDTRKTIPGYRLAQKYAVRMGGGANHRIGLYDGVLIKENHIASAGSIEQAIKNAMTIAPEDALVEVEVETLAQLDEALAAGANRIMLDNFDIETMRKGVEITAGRAELEASGNVSLETIAEIAATGVNYISIGAITKNIHAVDLSMRFQA